MLPKNLRSHVFVLVGAASLLAHGSLAATLTVEQDDSGDFVRVWDALTAAQDGDEIVVGPGWFGEEDEFGETRVVELGEKTLVLRGAGSGNGGTEITGLRIKIEASFEVSDILFRECACALQVREPDPSDGERLTVTDCVFRANTGVSGTGGAVYGDFTFPATFERCSFIENSATQGGGAIAYNNDVTLRDCEFVRNHAPSHGTVFCETMDVEGCLFWGNSSTTGKPGCAALSGSGPVRNSTFWANEGRVTLQVGGGPVENCIIGETVGGYGVECGYLWVICSWLCFNDWGNIGDCAPINSTFDQDPLFCDPENGDFRLRPDSPCLPGVDGNNDCGLIGAYDVGCGASPTIESSWGKVKANFR